MIHIPFNDKDYYLPENFNELSKKQLLWLARLMNEKDKEYHELEVLQMLLDLKLYQFFRMSNDAKERMLPFISWVFGENTLTAQLLPEYEGLHAPKGEFDNLTLGEFHYTETYYHQFTKGNIDALDLLIAVLYRRPKKFYDTKLDSDGDIRVKFNKNEIEYYAKLVKRWPPSVKTAIVIWYDGCKQQLVKLYKEVFEESGTDHNTEDTGMYSIIRNMSGDKFGNIDQVEKVLVHHAFYEITLIMEDNRRIEAEMKKHQPK